MFICPKCRYDFQLPKCYKCGFTVNAINGILQLSNDPDMVIEGDGDKYIGYEHIGDSYSGNRKYTIEEQDSIFAYEISKLTGEGVFLDIGCGDGCFSVPVAKYGTKVIAADISNSMLELLKEKANRNAVNLDKTIICRMNALNILLSDNSISTVVCNSVLHLISQPEKVIKEIYRVLKKDGCFICKDDAPSRDMPSQSDNLKYLEIVNELYSIYWRRLSEYSIYPKKYSWKYDRDAICSSLFSKKEEILLPMQKAFSIKMKDGFLPRFLGRGFSDQVEVPLDLHKTVSNIVLDEMMNKYGNDFSDNAFHGVQTDIIMTVYKK
jgi:ubiquinone/menaquinone biosynthesis C-methylase UbiE